MQSAFLGRESGDFEVQSDLRQRDELSLIIFNMTLESVVSVPSSGEQYEPSDEFDSDDSRFNNISQLVHILNRANNSIDNTNSVLEDARTLLKLTRNQNQAVKETIM